MSRIRIVKILGAILFVFGGVTVSILVTLFLWLKEDMAQFECQNKLRDIGVAALHQTSQEIFTSFAIRNHNLSPEKRLGWLAELGSQSAFGANSVVLVNKDSPWDARENLLPRVRLGRVNENPRTFIDPEMKICKCANGHHHRNSTYPHSTNYIGISGLGLDSAGHPLGHPRVGIFGYDRMIGPWDVKDGLSNTMAIVESDTAKGPWTSAAATMRGLDTNRQPYMGAGRQFGGLHHDLTNVLFADCSVRFVRNSMESKLFEGLSTIAGGEETSYVNR